MSSHPVAVWFRAAMNRDGSTGPLACPLTCPLAPLTHSLAPPCSLHSQAPIIHSLAPLTHSAHGKVDDLMTKNQAVLSHGALNSQVQSPIEPGWETGIGEMRRNTVFSLYSTRSALPT